MAIIIQFPSDKIVKPQLCNCELCRADREITEYRLLQQWAAEISQLPPITTPNK